MEEGSNGLHYLDRSQPCTFLQPSPRSRYNLSQLECEGLTPRLVTTQTRPTSTMKRDQGSHLPELTITSCDSQVPLSYDSQMPLLSTFRLNSKEMQELRETLLQQRKNLRTTNSVFTAETQAGNEESSSLCSNCSVRSSVVRQVENLASNKENFNYLNGNHILGRDETEDDGCNAETDIEKQVIASKTQDEELSGLIDADSSTSARKVGKKADSSDNIPSNNKGEVEVIENLI